MEPKENKNLVDYMAAKYRNKLRELQGIPPEEIDENSEVAKLCIKLKKEL